MSRANRIAFPFPVSGVLCSLGNNERLIALERAVPCRAKILLLHHSHYVACLSNSAIAIVYIVSGIKETEVFIVISSIKLR